MSNFKVSKSEFKANAFELFRYVEESGHRILVADRGKPTVEVRSYCGDKRRALDNLRTSVIRYDDPIDSIDIKNWSAE